MSTLILGLFVLTATVALSLSGLTIVRRRVPLSSLEQHRDVAGFVISVLGVVYGVLLGFVVVTVWDQYEKARECISGETSQIADLMQISAGFSDPIPRRIRQSLLNYAQLVVSSEWITMSKRERSMEAQRAFDRLWQGYRAIEPMDARESMLLAEGLARLAKLSDYRMGRLHASQSSVPSIVWIVLFFGAMITIAYTYLFGVERIIAHGIITAALSLEIALILFLVFVLDNPFRGDFKLTSEPFTEVMQRLAEMEKFER